MSGTVQIVQLASADEDPRADRQAEFTQLDLEMSFVDQDDVIAMVEGLIRRIWKHVLKCGGSADPEDDLCGSDGSIWDRSAGFTVRDGSW